MLLLFDVVCGVSGVLVCVSDDDGVILVNVELEMFIVVCYLCRCGCVFVSVVSDFECIVCVSGVFLCRLDVFGEVYDVSFEDLVRGAFANVSEDVLECVVVCV